jgi:hypothetical protein
MDYLTSKFVRLIPGPPIRYRIRSDLVGSNHPTKSGRFPGLGITNGTNGRILKISDDIRPSESDIYSGCRIPMKDGVSNYGHGYSKKS